VRAGAADAQHAVGPAHDGGQQRQRLQNPGPRLGQPLRERRLIRLPRFSIAAPDEVRTDATTSVDSVA